MRIYIKYLILALIMLVPASPGAAQHADFLGSAEAQLNKAKVVISDSLDARLDSLDTTWRLWSRIDGSEKDATHGWFSDLHTGLFRFGTHRMGITAGGTSRAIIDSNGVSAFPGLRLAPSQYSNYTDSAFTVTFSSGIPSLNLFGSDGDTGNITMDTGDRMLFRNFAGGYDFDVDPSVVSVTAWIDSTNITADGIGNDDIGPNTVTTTEIRDSTIDSTDVKDISLSVGDIANGANGFLLKEAADDSIEAYMARNSEELTFGDSLSTNYGIEPLGTAWIDSAFAKTNGGAIGDIAGLQDRLDEKQTKTAFVDSANAEIKRMFFPRRLNYPTMKDSLITGTSVVCLNDSIWDQPYMLASAWPDSGLFHRALNEALIGTVDTLTVGIFDHIPVANDSFVVYCRCSDVDSAHIDITIKGANGTTVLTQAITLTVANAWQRFVYYRAAAVLPQDYLITYRYRCYGGHWIDATPVTAKCAS